MTLKNLRLDKKLSQEKAARELGIASRTYCRWERGETKIPDVAVPALAQLFGVTQEEIKAATPSSMKMAV